MPLYRLTAPGLPVEVLRADRDRAIAEALSGFATAKTVPLQSVRGGG